LLNARNLAAVFVLLAGTGSNITGNDLGHSVVNEDAVNRRDWHVVINISRDHLTYLLLAIIKGYALSFHLFQLFCGGGGNG